MVAPSNNSFIPKRGPVKQKRKNATRQVYIFTYISYILTFATLLGAGGVFFYDKYVERQLNEEIAALNQEIDSFSHTDMRRVTEFDQRLQQANSRLDASVSISSLFTALEAATVDTVKVLNLNLSRVIDDKISLNVAVETDSFDSTIFQRGVYTRNQLVSDVEISNVLRAAQQVGGVDTTTGRSVVTFQALLSVPVSAIPYQPPRTVPLQTAPITITQPAPAASAGASVNIQSSEEAVEEDVNNPES